MSLTLLPAVDVRDGKAVRLRQGESGSETDYGSPFEAARTWVEAGAEWIHLVDLDAAFGTGNNRDQLREIVHELGDGAYKGVRMQAGCGCAGKSYRILYTLYKMETISRRHPRDLRIWSQKRNLYVHPGCFRSHCLRFGKESHPNKCGY